MQFEDTKEEQKTSQLLQLPETEKDELNQTESSFATARESLENDVLDPN